MQPASFRNAYCYFHFPIVWASSFTLFSRAVLEGESDGVKRASIKCIDPFSISFSHPDFLSPSPLVWMELEQGKGVEQYSWTFSASLTPTPPK
jgi:hypothetical protein